MASWFRSVVLDRIIPSINAFVEARTLQVWLLALIIGAGVAYAAILFRTLIGLVQLAWLGTMHESVVTAAAYVPWPVILLAPAAGGLVIGYLLQNHVPGRRAHGVADVIEARALRDCQMQTRTGLWSALISAISIGCGASVGREGPVVHLGATIASAIENYMQLPAAARRTLLAAGVAAAVSASFNAPMAGVLFACEVILRHYAMSAFVPIVIASVAGTAIARMHLGDFPAFIIPQYQITSYLEFPAFVLLGLTCAAVAILFQSSLMVTERLLWGIRMPLWVRPMIGGFAVGLIALAFPHVLGVGYEATDMALKQQLPLLLLLALLVAKTAATAISLASRFGGGVFSPSLYLGAMAGGAFGIIAESIVPQAASSNGLYAILGMGGVAAAVLGAPISTTMIVFELTEGYAMAIAILLTVSIANGATIAVLGESFFHWQLATRGLFLGEGPHKEIMRKLTVRDFARLVPADDAEERRRAPDDQGPWLLMGDTVESALRAFDRSGEQIIPIVHDNDIHRVIGHAYHVDALHIYNRALVEAHVEEHR
ncbi:MAG: chloride channel protein [Rhizobiales bacterium]|nr:chloride channel protein [Hyphomicrobiales bacterium]